LKYEAANMMKKIEQLEASKRFVIYTYIQTHYSSLVYIYFMMHRRVWSISVLFL